MATKTIAAKTQIANAAPTNAVTKATAPATKLTNTKSISGKNISSKSAAVKKMATKKAEAAPDFNPTETPTGKYKPGKIRDRNLTNIINAAEEEFVHNGFRGASIQNIADRAGIP